ncbi:unnamed protein product, partial [Heterosigma akashiwo]
WRTSCSTTRWPTWAWPPSSTAAWTRRPPSWPGCRAARPWRSCSASSAARPALNRAVQASFDFDHRQGDFPDLTTDELVLLVVATILK